MDTKRVLIVLIAILSMSGTAAAVYSTYNHAAVRIADGKDIDMNGQSIGNGSSITAQNISGVIYANQYTTPQNAIDSCSANGCVVDFGVNRTYTISQIVIQKNNIELRGNNVTLIGTNSALGAYQGLILVGFGMGTALQVSNVKISGFTIDGSGIDRNIELSVLGAKDVQIRNMRFLANNNPVEAPVYIIGDGMNSGTSAQSSNILLEDVYIDGLAATNTISAVVVAGGFNGNVAVDGITFNRMHITNFSIGSGIRAFTYTNRLVRNMYVTNSDFYNVSNTSTAVFAVGSESGIIGFWVRDNRFQGILKNPQGLNINFHASYNAHAVGNYMNNTAATFALGGTFVNPDLYSKQTEITGNVMNNTNAIDWDSSLNTNIHDNYWVNTTCNVAGILGSHSNDRFQNNIIVNPHVNQTGECDSVNATITTSNSGVIISGNTIDFRALNSTTPGMKGILENPADWPATNYPNVYRDNVFKNITVPISLQSTYHSITYQNYGAAPFFFGANATQGGGNFSAFGAGDTFINLSKAPNLCMATAAGKQNWVFAGNMSGNC